LPDGQISKNLSSPLAKNILLHREGETLAYIAVSLALEEGRFAIVTNVGRGERWTPMRS
jgi:hypothetical protein